jgi:hypothetical protein
MQCFAHLILRMWCDDRMSDDIEQRLATTAQAVRELEVCGQHCTDLQGRLESAQAEVAATKAKSAAEEHEVERLEHMSLTRVLASLHGSRDEALARERADASAARFRAAQAESQLAAVQQELAAADDQRRQLAGAPSAYADALTAKEHYLAQVNDPRSATLLQLADERGRLTAEISAMHDAERRAADAAEALAAVQDRLGSASSWSTYDTYFGGGMIGNAVKHQRMDEAAEAAAEADRRLAALRTELVDVASMEPTAPQLAVSAGLRFTDIFFNNIFTDLAVGHQIRQAQDTVDRSVQLVAEVRAKLADRTAAATERVAAIEAQRQQLLVQ